MMSADVILCEISLHTFRFSIKCRAFAYLDHNPQSLKRVPPANLMMCRFVFIRRGIPQHVTGTRRVPISISIRFVRVSNGVRYIICSNRLLCGIIVSCHLYDKSPLEGDLGHGIRALYPACLKVAHIITSQEKRVADRTRTSLLVNYICYLTTQQLATAVRSNDNPTNPEEPHSTKEPTLAAWPGCIERLVNYLLK